MKLQDIPAESIAALRTLLRSRSAILVRIRHGIAANMFGQVVSVAIQLATLPVLLRNWGVEAFGIWTLISVVPAYLGMADLGFTTAATSKMTMAYGRGDLQAARNTLKCVLALSLALAVAGTTLAGIGLYAWSADALSFGQRVDGVAIKFALMWLVVATLVSLGWNALSGALKASGQYPVATVFADSTRLVEALAILGVAGLFGGGIAEVAATSMVVRIVSTIIGVMVIRHRAPWAELTLRGADLGELRSLAKPALAVLAIPIGYSLSLQGMILVVGAAIDVRAVALYTATRTVGRLSSQAVALANHASMPEVARAAGAGDWNRAGRLIWLNILAAAVVAVVFLAGVNLLGPGLIAIWLGGHLQPGWLLLLLVSTACAIQAMTNASGNMLIALNSHERYAYAFLAMSVLAVVLAYLVASGSGLTGVAVAIMGVEAAMLLITVLEVRRRLRLHADGAA